jgi:hypothetical protein
MGRLLLHCEGSLEDTMLDLLYIAYVIAGFAVLWLIVKGIETFER